MSAAQQQRTRTALLTTEAALLERMRRAVDTIVKAHFSTDARKEAVFAGINATADALQQHLPAVIAAGRADARNAALKTLHADADALRRELRRAGEADTLPELPMPSDSVQADRAQARSSAMAFAGAWQTAALAQVAAAAVADRTIAPKAIARAATKSTVHHVDRIAATENSTAFNDERAAGAATMTAPGQPGVAPVTPHADRPPGARGVIEPQPTPAAAAKVAEATAAAPPAHPPKRPIDEPQNPAGKVITIRVWDSTLDARTCPVCAAADGVWTELGMPFLLRGRAVEPGKVHPNCRCVAHLATRRA